MNLVLGMQHLGCRPYRFRSYGGLRLTDQLYDHSLFVWPAKHCHYIRIMSPSSSMFSHFWFPINNFLSDLSILLKDYRSKYRSNWNLEIIRKIMTELLPF